MKLLSIIVPVYNSEPYLRKCLDSLTKQDIPSEEYEIILVDDGSKDNSRALAERYAQKHSNITILTRPNGGTSAARNTGIRAATGKYLYFVDPDDYILEDSIRNLIDKMEGEDLDVLRFAYMEVDENGQETHSVKHPEPIDYSSSIMDGTTFLSERMGPSCFVWTFLFKTALIKNNDLYFQERVYFDDTPWLPQVLYKAKRVDSVNWERHFYLIRHDSLVRKQDSLSLQKKIDGQLYLIKELQRQMRAIDSSSAVKWYRMMLSHCVLSLLSYVRTSANSSRHKYIRELRNQNVLPLSFYRFSFRNRIKLALINLSPTLYCRLSAF